MTGDIVKDRATENYPVDRTLKCREKVTQRKALHNESSDSRFNRSGKHCQRIGPALALEKLEK